MGPLLNISVTRKDRMCFSSLTIFSDSHRLVPKCLPCWVVFHLLSVTSPPWPLTWVACRSVLPPPPRDPLPPYRLSMCLLTTCQILLQPPPSLTWTPQLSCQDQLLNVESTPLWILLTPLAVSWTPTSLEANTTTLPEVYKRFSRTTNLSRISLPFWVWTSCLRKTNLRSREQERLKDSFLSHSRSLRFSPATPVSSSPLQKPSLDSRKSLRANTITSLKLLSTWLATLTKSSLRPNVWQLNVENKQAFSFGQTIA